MPKVLKQGYFCEGVEYDLVHKKYKVSIFKSVSEELVLVVDSDSMSVIAVISGSGSCHDDDCCPVLHVNTA